MNCELKQNKGSIVLGENLIVTDEDMTYYLKTAGSRVFVCNNCKFSNVICDSCSKGEIDFIVCNKCSHSRTGDTIKTYITKINSFLEWVL